MTVNNQLIDAQISHNIDLQRYANHVVNRIIRLLNDVDADLYAQIVSVLDRLPKESFTVERLDALLSSVRTLNASNYAQISNELNGELKSLVEYEAGYQKSLFENTIPVQINLQTVNVEQVYAAALSRPFQGRLLKEWMQGLEADKANRIRDALRIGYVENQTTDQIIRRIRGSKSLNYKDGIIDINKRSAESVVRTALTHYGNFTKQRFYEDNSDVIKGLRWTSTLDARTSEICASRDGKIYPIDSGPRPPAHFNCLLGDTNVATCSSVSNAYKRAYKGLIVDIVTKSNRRISITPNHPVLTREGWKAAGLLNNLDELVCVDDVSVFGDNYKNSVEAKIGDIFSFLDVSVESSFIGVRPTTPEDFHGDVTDSEVNIISIDSHIWNDVIKRFRKSSVKDWFISRARINLSLFGFGSVYKLFMSGFRAASRFVSFGSEFCNFLWSGFRHSCKLLLRPVSKGWVHSFKVGNNWHGAARQVEMAINAISADSAFVSVNNRLFDVIRKFKVSGIFDRDAIVNKHSLDSSITNAVNIGNFINADVINGAKFDNVISVCFREVDAHVYNLENKDNWYTSNGIITHNCRSIMVAVTKSWKELGFNIDELPPSTRSSMEGQVSEKLTYSDWLRKQSIERQEEILGVTKAKLFRDGGLTLDRFVNNTGHVYTLDELRKRDSDAFRKAGI